MNLWAEVWETPEELDSQHVAVVNSLKDLQFSTEAQGGFGDCSFTVEVGSWDAVRWYRSFLGYHVVIFDHLGRRVYEGRISDTRSSSRGVEITCLGYFSHASELIHGLYYPAGETVTPSDIVIDTIDIAWNTSRLWRNDYSHIQRLVQNIAPQDFLYDKKLSDAIEVAVKYGNDTVVPQPMYFAIWENRMPYFYEQPSLLNPTWFIRTEDFSEQNGLSLSRTRDSVWNKIQVVYDDPLIGKAFTPWFENKESQRLFGIREGTLNIGSALPEVANLVGQLAINAYAFPEQSSSVGVHGRVYHVSGTVDYPYMVRAGQVIQVVDFDPSVVQLVSGNTGLDATASFVLRTRYNADDNSLELELGKRSYALDLLLARLDLSGGSIR